eukprot:1181381-Prorocentrum_minimum.AAC.1
MQSGLLISSRKSPVFYLYLLFFATPYPLRVRGPAVDGGIADTNGVREGRDPLAQHQLRAAARVVEGEGQVRVVARPPRPRRTAHLRITNQMRGEGIYLHAGPIR